MSRRRNQGGGDVPEGTVALDSVPDALSHFHELAAADPEWIRVLLWETLERGESRRAR